MKERDPQSVMRRREANDRVQGAGLERIRLLRRNEIQMDLSGSFARRERDYSVAPTDSVNCFQPVERIAVEVNPVLQLGNGKPWPKVVGSEGFTPVRSKVHLPGVVETEMKVTPRRRRQICQ